MLIDKLVLFGLSLLSLPFAEPPWVAVLAILAAVAVGALSSYFEGVVSRCLCMAYLAACLLVPPFVVFLPIVVYDSAGQDNPLFRFCWVLVLPACLFAEGLQLLAMVILSSGTAFLLHHRTSAQTKTRRALFTLFDDTTERAARLEQKNHALLEKQDYEVRLATLAERNRIAREIHDNVGHQLTRALLQLSALGVTHRDDAALTQELGSVRHTLSDAMDSIRDSVHNLHDESFDLRLQLTAMTSDFTACPVRLRYDADVLPGALQYCFAAIVGEALNNIARHSNATVATVTVTEHPAFCRLTVEDNGTKKPEANLRGIGLRNMADRVEALGGVFRAEYRQGFRIFISVPKALPQAEKGEE